MRVVCIIPTENKRPAMLEEAIASVSAQTMPVELIIEGGEGNAWEKANRGITRSDADAFFLLSDDDKIHPSFAQATREAMERERADIVTTFMQLFGDEEGIHGAEDTPWMTSLVRKSMWERVGGYDVFAGVAADKEFYARCLKAGAKWVKLDAPLFLYRKHQGQWSHTADWKESNDYFAKKHV